VVLNGHPNLIGKIAIAEASQISSIWDGRKMHAGDGEIWRSLVFLKLRSYEKELVCTDSDYENPENSSYPSEYVPSHLFDLLPGSEFAGRHAPFALLVFHRKAHRW